MSAARGGKSSCTGALSDLGEEHDGFIVHVFEPSFDLDAAAADVEVGNLELRRKRGL